MEVLFKAVTCCCRKIQVFGNLFWLTITSWEHYLCLGNTSSPIKTQPLPHPGVCLPVCRRQCECQHNTCGESCDRCCPGFNQKPWRAATVDSPNECQRKCSCVAGSCNKVPCAARQFEALTVASSPPRPPCPSILRAPLSMPSYGAVGEHSSCDMCDEKHCTNCRTVTSSSFRNSQPASLQHLHQLDANSLACLA